MSRIIVTGGASGLGKAISNALSNGGHEILLFDKKYANDVRYPDIGALRDFDPHILINNAGINLLKPIQDVTEDEFDKVIDVNLIGIFRMVQACLPNLIKNKGTILNIVSDAAHRPMRFSSAYNASKGGAKILTAQMARELTSQGVTVFSVSPNKLSGTEMSEKIDEEVCKTRGWSYKEMRKYQMAGLVNGEETPPQYVAEFIAFLLQDKEHHRFLSGCDIPYGL